MRPATRKVGGAKSLLILGYGAVGDLVFFLPVLESLRKVLTTWRIVFVSNPYPTTDELLPASGLVDEIVKVTVGKKDEAYRDLRRRIRSSEFDAVIVSQATPLRFFASDLLSIPLRIGHCQAVTAPRKGWSLWRYWRWKTRRAIIMEELERRLVLNAKVRIERDKTHSVERNLRLLAPLEISEPQWQRQRPSIPTPDSARAEAQGLLDAFPQKGPGPWVALHIGSPHSLYGKIWPAEQWARAAAMMAGKTPFNLVVVGGAEEAETVERFAAAWKRPFLNAVGRLGLLTSAAILRQCGLVIGNDTGMLKMAMALGIRTVTVWGPSDRLGWGAYWDRDRHAEVFRALECSPCVRLGFVNEGSGVLNFSNCGDRPCLSKLREEDVAAAGVARLRAVGAG
jgi:ADP-heptose:LPS heptosyltransferase